MTEDQLKIRRIILVTIIVIFMSIVSIYLYKYLSTGTISIKTNSTSDYIDLEQVIPPNSNAKAYSRQTKGQLSVRLKPGNYTVTVNDSLGNNAVSKSINLSARQHVKYNLSIKSKISSPEPVYSQETGSVEVGQGQLSFIDLGNPDGNLSGSNQLVQDNSEGSVSMPFSSLEFRGISWANPNLGVGLTTDNNVYVIQNDVATQLNLPFQSNGSTRIGYSMAPNGTIYVSNTSSVYSESLTGNFKQLYNAGQDKITMSVNAASNSGADIVESDSSDRDDGNLVLLSSGGHIVSKDIDADSSYWSPNGDYLLIEGDDGNFILNTDLNQVGLAPGNSSTVYAWLNNSSIIYSIDNQLWAYNTRTNQSEKISQLPLKENITAIYPDNSDQYIYFSDDNGQVTQLFRVGLKGQLVNMSISPLSVFLPALINSCSINFLNFGNQPTILISYPDGGSQETCQANAQQELQTYGIDITQFQYQFSQLSDGE